MKRIHWIAVLTVLFALAGSVAVADVQAQGKDRGGEKKAQLSQSQDKGKQVRPAKTQQRTKAQQARPQQKGRAQAERPAGPQKQARVERQTGKPETRAARGQSKQEQRASRQASRPKATAKRGAGHSAFNRGVAANELRPNMRRFAASKRAPERLAAGAVSRAFARGVGDDELLITPVSGRVYVRNRAGALLLDLDDDRARNLGYWDVVPVGTRVRSGAPAFCRSGAGHPVWGRQWCIDKGFGLGRYQDVDWGRTRSIGDIIFARRIVDRETLLRDALVATVGNVVLDRLGLHALTLGYTEPLTGVWVAQPTGPQVLLVNSGTYPVAEVVDLNRDDRADMMVFALRSW
jgi:hypothetical protein